MKYVLVYSVCLTCGDPCDGLICDMCISISSNGFLYWIFFLHTPTPAYTILNESDLMKSKFIDWNTLIIINNNQKQLINGNHNYYLLSLLFINTKLLQTLYNYTTRKKYLTVPIHSLCVVSLLPSFLRTVLVLVFPFNLVRLSPFLYIYVYSVIGC